MEEKFLLAFGFAKPWVEDWVTKARENGTSIEEELLSDVRVMHDAYFGALAKLLELPFLAEIDASDVADVNKLDIQLVKPRVLRLATGKGLAVSAIVPDIAMALSLHARFRREPWVRSRYVITTPAAVRSAVWATGARRRVREAANDLFDYAPALSARSVAWAGQGFVAGTFLTFVAAMLIAYTQETVHALHLGLSLSFLVLVGLRGLAISRGARSMEMGPLAEMHALPTYSVLVALYREEAIVPQIVAALDRLNWPLSRLDIKLVCEADDHATILALKAMNLPAHYEIVEVPSHAPRTKPKALNYALAGARGDFLVIYDAEDQPHPDQLREAYQRFSESPPEVACLQAPLLVGNGQENWLSAIFALEYAGLFRRLLPYLAQSHQPLPLGGTSNHFRIEALTAAGGWDPYNVTEDADLGLRLHRLGYVSETIGRPTIEAAPTERAVWLPQRTRWFKGWMQTWLVMMRQPMTILRDLGLARTMMFHILVTGMLVSALGHPFILVFIAMFFVHLWDVSHATTWQILLFSIDCINIFAAYTLFVRLGYEAMGRQERKRLARCWPYVPLYWMLISLAAWRAVIELKTKPFFWSKTPHRPRVVSRSVEKSERPDQAAGQGIP